MKYWSREHGALLAALRASAVVPPLVRRLSLERVSPDDAEIRRLRGWASSLRADPGWAAIASVIETPTAWPRAWDDAVAAGFSPESDHHHALLFGRFCERFVAAADFEGASWTWRQGIDAWARVFATDYPVRLFDDLAPRLSEDGPGRDELLRTMLDTLLDPRVTDLQEAAGAAKPAAVPDIERRRLRFAWRALQRARTIDTDRDPHGTLGRLSQRASEACSSATTAVLTRFEKLVEELDLSVAADATLLGPFQWVAAYVEIVGYSEAAVTTVISSIVDTCWALRRVGRDNIPEFATLLRLGAPFNSNLFDRLTNLDSAFGHNSRCADFLVFAGEQKKESAARRTTFEAGLKVCPGHRNSAMLLSYEVLGEARRVLSQAALTPAVASLVPGTSRRVDELVRRAADLLDEVEQIYPYNEALPDVRKTLDNEARRLHVELD